MAGRLRSLTLIHCSGHRLGVQCLLSSRLDNNLSIPTIMPRTYIPKKGSKKKLYKNFTEDNLEAAIDAAQKGESYRDIEINFGVPKSTMHRRMKGLNSKQMGGQTSLSMEEEQKFVDHLIAVSKWGFPFSQLDLRLIVKASLDQAGRTVKKFKNNLPGDDWARSFLKRHKNTIGARNCQNIKNARADLKNEDFVEYFTRLNESIEGIPPTHILNYDQTNLSDDPGLEKLIFKRGVKYPERIMNYSKGATSIMFAGTAAGMLLEPYVVYKAGSMWNSWTRGGPKDARYNRSKSGWFDAACFDDWFRTVVIPWAKRLDGTKVVIGDNLSSHFSSDVLKLCEEYNINFICLPPNSTHLTQPLDVAFYGPMKRVWRKLLKEWKIRNSKQATLPKDEFPHLLKELLQQLNSANLVAGFKACGIYPYDPQQVLKKFPDDSEDLQLDVSGAVLEQLKKMREGDKKPKQRRKKMQVEPGKSVTSADLDGTTVDVNVPVNPRTPAADAEESDNHSDASEEEEMEVSSVDEKSDSDEESPIGNVKSGADVKSAAIKIGDCVKVLNDPFKNYYAQVVNNSYGDEFEIQYFKFKCGYHVVNSGDIDSRPQKDLQKVAWRMDRREHYFFENM